MRLQDLIGGTMVGFIQKSGYEFVARAAKFEGTDELMYIIGYDYVD